MTLLYSCNVPSTSYSVSWYDFKEFMKTTVGWTVTRSSDSSTFGAGDNIGGPGSIVTGSWFVLQDPAGNRELLYSFPSSMPSLSISYSVSNGFTGGGATTPPTATDEQTLNTLDILYNASSTYLNMWADDSDGYSFGVFSYVQGTSDISPGGFIMDQTISDPYPDNVVFINTYGSNCWQYPAISNEFSTSTASTGCRGYQYYGESIQTFGNVAAQALFRISGFSTPVAVIPRDMGPDKYTGNGTHVFPLLFAKYSREETLHPYFKGVSKYVRWVGDTRTDLDTLSINSERDYIILQDIAMPWDGTVPLI